MFAIVHFVLLDIAFGALLLELAFWILADDAPSIADIDIRLTSRETEMRELITQQIMREHLCFFDVKKKPRAVFKRPHNLRNSSISNHFFNNAMSGALFQTFLFYF